jgi:hypothetical protein
MVRTFGQFNAEIERLKKLEALAARPGTAGEGDAARAAIERIRTRLGMPEPVPARRKPPKPPARRPDGRPLRMDEEILCDAVAGVFRPCKCGGNIFEVWPGVGPHAAQIVCKACRRGGRWLSRAHFGGAA